MKTKIATVLFAVATMLTSACEQHKWSDTKKLFNSHSPEGAGAHGDAHGGHGEKKADDAHGHGEKKADAAHH